MKSQLFTILTTTLTTIFIAVGAQAQDFALSAGFRNTSASADTAPTGTTYSISAKNGFQLGGIGFFPLNEQVFLRSGLLYTQRFVEFSSTTGTIVTKTDVELSYIDIPATVMYKFSDYGGVFGGVVVGLNQSKDCKTSTTSTNCTGTNSSITPITLGLSFKFAPNMGGEFSYESTSGSLATSVTEAKSIGINFLVFFE
jgi:hypothetical protein